MSGIFGVVSQNDCANDLFYGTDYHSHLGTEFAGLSIQGKHLHRGIHRIAHGQFKNLFDEFHRHYAGEMGVGVISNYDPQPIMVQSRFGAFNVVTAGLVTNSDQLAEDLISDGVVFNEVVDGKVNQTELVAKMIAQADTIPQGIESVFNRITGSVSLLLMTSDGIYGATDHSGRLPLAIGVREGSIAAASETCAFPNLGYKIKKHLQPGEIVFFDGNGLREATGAHGQRKICSFLWIYTGYPASCYEGVSVESVRERCGKALATKDDIEADLVAGVPDSGIGHAIGYAMHSRLPFRRPLVKYSAGYGRSYTPPSQEVRDRIARMKLIPIEDIIKDNKLIVCEDSIVRGTQLKNLTIQKLWQAGAAEVHIRAACPPLMFPCKYNLSTRSEDELITRRAIRALENGMPDDISDYLNPRSEKYKSMVNWICRELNCTSLAYLRLNDMIEAIGLSRDDICSYCWSGRGD